MENTIAEIKEQNVIYDDRKKKIDANKQQQQQQQKQIKPLLPPINHYPMRNRHHSPPPIAFKHKQIIQPIDNNNSPRPWKDSRPFNYRGSRNTQTTNYRQRTLSPLPSLPPPTTRKRIIDEPLNNGIYLHLFIYLLILNE